MRDESVRIYHESEGGIAKFITQPTICKVIKQF